MILASKRRWFTFSLRTLFVVVTLCGLVLGWMVWNLHWIRQRREYIGEELGAAVPAPGMLWLFGEYGRCAFAITYYAEPGETTARQLKPSELDDLKLACRLFPESQIFWSLQEGGSDGKILVPETLYYNGLDPSGSATH